MAPLITHTPPVETCRCGSGQNPDTCSVCFTEFDRSDTSAWDGGESYPWGFDLADYAREEEAGHGDGLQSVSGDTPWTPREFPAMSDADWDIAATDEAARGAVNWTVPF